MLVARAIIRSAMRSGKTAAVNVPNTKSKIMRESGRPTTSALIVSFFIAVSKSFPMIRLPVTVTSSVSLSSFLSDEK